MAKIAIASTDGVTINEHFGKAKEFLIYEVEESGSYQLLETRKNVLNLPSNEAHTAIAATAELLTDVNFVLVNQIGPKASEVLERKGIVSYALTGSIEKALQAYAKRSKLAKNIIGNPVPGTSRSCGGGCSGGCHC